MNVETGRLINTLGCTGEELEELWQAGYKSVPEELQPEAEKELAGKKETVVDLKSGNPLANWAAGQREKKNKRKKMAKESRRKNRR